MEANSLFKTRQLTVYRKNWPHGQKGCLFYVADIIFEKECAQGAVYLIESSVREDDERGFYDKLHKSEIMSLSAIQPVAKGFAAFLLTQDSNAWIENREILYHWWSLYYEWCLNNRPKSGFETEYILCECQNWKNRIEELIKSYLYDPARLSLYGKALLHVIKSVFVRNMESVDDVMRKWHPYVSICKNIIASSNMDYIRYEYSINAMKRGEKMFLQGIQAVILQYAIIQHIRQDIERIQSLDKIIEVLLNQHAENSQNILSFAKIKILKYDIETAEKLYEFSWKRNKELYERTYKLDLPHYALSEKEIELLFVSKLYDREMNLYRKKEINSFLFAENIQNMRSLLIGYFKYLFKKMEGYKYVHNLYAEFEAEFPELRKDNHRERTQNLPQEENDVYSFVCKSEDVQVIINKLNEYMIGKTRPKDVMMPIRAAMEAGVIYRPTFSQLQSIFPNCPHNKSLVSLYTNKQQYDFEGEAYKKNDRRLRNTLVKLPS